MKGKNILVVTDDSEFIDKIKNELGRDKVALTCVKDGQVAIEMVSVECYYAMIVDIDLSPVLSYDLLYKLGLLPCSVPIVAVAGKITADNVILAYDFGVMDMIVKNFDPGELVAVLNKAASLRV